MQKIERMNIQRYKMLFMMITGACIIFFTGYAHVWSIYQPYVVELTGWSEGQASMGFYLSSCAFVVGNIGGGKIQSKVKPRLILFSGGCIFTLSIFLSAFCLSGSPLMFCLTYGVLQGLGQGMVYTVVLATAQKWFPKRTGFASGIIVTSNGLCAFLMAPLSKILLEQNGPKITLFVVSILIAVAWIGSTVFFCMPQKRKCTEFCVDNTEEKTKEYTSSEMLRTKKFYLMVIAMLFGLLPYYLISPISQTFLTEHGVVGNIAVSAVMAGSLMNACTRLILPTLSDKIGQIRCIQAIQILLFVAMLILAVGESKILVLAVIFSYICFGGMMGTFPSLTSFVFGLQHFGENYGFVMIGMILASLGAPMLRLLLEKIGISVNQTFIVGACFAFVSFQCMRLLNQELQQDN